ncbi:MAG: hypothetical protein RL417_1238, partial [Pseudomonadota bacterium]
MTAPRLDHRRIADLSTGSLPRSDHEVIDCGLPAEIASLGGRVSQFDPVAKELRQIPLEAAFRFWLSERLPGRAAPGGGRLSGEVVAAVMRGDEMRCEPHRLVIVPTLPIEKIPERSGDTGGALKLLEPWIGGEGGVVVLFSSPDRFYSHHQ